VPDVVASYDGVTGRLTDVVANCDSVNGIG